MRQPAISSASSIARRIDCVVASMLTTTPLLIPREGCEPRPMISRRPSAVVPPTIATTLWVPMSRPTRRSRGAFLVIPARRGGADTSGVVDDGLAPADRKSIDVVKIDIRHLLETPFERRSYGPGQAADRVQRCPPSEPQFDSLPRSRGPFAARVLFERDRRERRVGELLAERHERAAHRRLLAIRAGQARRAGEVGRQFR